MSHRGHVLCQSDGMTDTSQDQDIQTVVDHLTRAITDTRAKPGSRQISIRVHPDTELHLTRIAALGGNQFAAVAAELLAREAARIGSDSNFLHAYARMTLHLEELAAVTQSEGGRMDPVEAARARLAAGKRAFDETVPVQGCEAACPGMGGPPMLCTRLLGHDGPHSNAKYAKLLWDDKRHWHEGDEPEQES